MYLKNPIHQLTDVPDEYASGDDLGALKEDN